jgi:hypothetical protein
MTTTETSEMSLIATNQTTEMEISLTPVEDASLNPALEMSLIATNQAIEMEIPLIPVEDASLNLEAIKRTRVDSPLELREESPKKSQKQFNQDKGQRVPDASLMEMIEEVRRQQLNSEKKVSEQMKSIQQQLLDTEKKNLALTKTIMVLEAKIVSTQKTLASVQKTVNVLPQKEKIVPPVTQTSPKMTEEEEEVKMREGFDYGHMKGNEGWTTLPVESQKKSVPSKTEEHPQKVEITSTTSTGRPSITSPQLKSFVKAVKMSQAQFIEKTRKVIQLVKDPCLSLLQKEECDEKVEITSMTIKIRLNTKGQTCPLVSARKIIEQTVGKLPLSISVISPTLFQILYKTEDTVSFQKLLIPNRIETVEAKKENFQHWDINRIAQLYLRGYFKELARAALQDLTTPTVELVLARATELVKLNMQNKLMQKRWLFNIQKDKIAFLTTAVDMTL